MGSQSRGAGGPSNRSFTNRCLTVQELGQQMDLQSLSGVIASGSLQGSEVCLLWSQNSEISAQTCSKDHQRYLILKVNLDQVTSLFEGVRHIWLRCERKMDGVAKPSDIITFASVRAFIVAEGDTDLGQLAPFSPDCSLHKLFRSLPTVDSARAPGTSDADESLRYVVQVVQALHSENSGAAATAITPAIGRVVQCVI